MKASAARSAAEMEQALTGIPGFNPQLGLGYVARDCVFYLKMLRLFILNHSNAAHILTAQLQSGDCLAAVRTAHTLKGLAATIGAVDIQARAGALEYLLRARPDAPEASADIARLDQDLAVLIGALEARI